MKINQYEAMFLLENNAANADFEGTAGQVDQILEKHGMKLVHKEKWDERKLAYEIKGHRRATYYLVYCEGESSAMVGIEEDLGLNEVVLRHMFIRLEDEMEKHIEQRATEREALAEDSRRNSLSGWGDRRGDKRRGGGGDGGSSRPASDVKKSSDQGEADAKPKVETKEEAASS